MNVTITCKSCKKEQNILVADEAAYARWKESRTKGEAGNYIQNAFPELTPDEREILISGICGTCFDNLFGPDCGKGKQPQ